MALIYPAPVAARTPDVPQPHYALNKWDAGGDPTVNDDETDGYEPGSFWFNVVTPYRFWVCTDAAEGAAVWREISVERFNGFVSAVAGENLSATNLVNLYSDAGTLKARKANATDGTKPCDGFVIVSATAGQSLIVFTAPGLVRTGLSGLTVGDELYLSTTNGAATATAPSSSGNAVQRIGKALSASTAIFYRGEVLELA